MGLKMKIIVPVSGGKDSQLCLQLALQQHGVDNVIAVHNATNYDHPLTNQHLKDMEDFYKVKIHITYSDKYDDVFDFIEKSGSFPSSLARSCTSALKQKPFAKWLKDNNYCDGNYVIWMGMRKDESLARATKYDSWDQEIEMTLNDFSSIYKAKLYQNIKVRLPIVDWLDQEVFAEIAKAGAPLNPLYGKGHKRVGCYPCLLAGNDDWKLAAEDPVGRKHMKRLLEIEEKFVVDKNPRKLIKIHPTRDVRALLEGDLFSVLAEERSNECSWCSI